MKREEIMELISHLAKAQGYWSGVYTKLSNMEQSTRESLLTFWEEKNFKDELDFILYMEG